MSLFGNKDEGKTVNTEATSSVNAIAAQLEGNDTIPAAITGGYISYGIAIIEVAGKKVEGISTEKGFWFPDSLGDEAMATMKDYAARGFAYELSADSE